MARETTKWPSTRWPITKIMSSDGCNVIGWLQWEQSPLGDGAVVRFPRIWMSSGECRFRSWWASGVSKATLHGRGTRPLVLTAGVG